MIDVLAIQQALGAWVRSALSISESQLLWAGQGAPEPGASVTDWLSLRFGDVVALSSLDGVQHYATPGTPAPGQEITLRQQGLRRFTLGIQMVTRRATVGNGWAVAVLSKLQTRLRLPPAQAAFAAAGIALFSVGPVTNLSGLNRQAFEGRALLELGFYVVDVETDFTTFIQHVEGTATVGGTALPFSASLEE